MADAHLRQGLRILFSGGAHMLETEDLSKLYHLCKTALDERVYEVVDIDVLFAATNRRCRGGITRLKKAYLIKYNKSLDAKEDLIKICPRALLSVDGYGTQSLLAYKRSLEDQLKQHNLPLPTRWQQAPSWELDRFW